MDEIGATVVKVVLVVEARAMSGRTVPMIRAPAKSATMVKQFQELRGKEVLKFFCVCALFLYFFTVARVPAVGLAAGVAGGAAHISAMGPARVRGQTTSRHLQLTFSPAAPSRLPTAPVSVL